jgi:hypothetical protein
VPPATAAPVGSAATATVNRLLRHAVTGIEAVCFAAGLTMVALGLTLQAV